MKNYSKRYQKSNVLIKASILNKTENLNGNKFAQSKNNLMCVCYMDVFRGKHGNFP